MKMQRNINRAKKNVFKANTCNTFFILTMFGPVLNTSIQENAVGD